MQSRGLIRSWGPIIARTATSVIVRSINGNAAALTPGIRRPLVEGITLFADLQLVVVAKIAEIGLSRLPC